MARFPRNLPALLLLAAMAASAAVTVVLCRHTTFYADTWELLVGRTHPTVDTLLKPHNEHLIVFPVLIEEVLLRVFGMTSETPELVVLILFLISTAALIYVYVGRRLGSWLGLFAALLILFLGPAWEVLLWPFQITFCGPLLFGLAMLLALEREDRLGDVAGCVFLIAALGFSSLGVPFIVAAAVAVFAGPRERWRGRAYVWVIPLLLFAAWYVGWGHDAESHMSVKNILASPQFVLNSIAVDFGALSGLGTETGTLVVNSAWGIVIAVLVTAAIAVWWRLRRPRFDRGLWPIATAAVVNWFLTAFNAFVGREPTASRYQYIGAVFVLLILANLLRDIRPNRNWIIGGAVVTALVVGPNIVVLHSGSKVLEQQAVITRSDTAALEIAKGTVDPAFALSPEVAGTPALVNVDAENYLRSVEEFGSPAYSIDELNDAPEEGRRQADILLAGALALHSTSDLPLHGPGQRGACVVAGGPGGPPEVQLRPGLIRFEATAGAPVAIALRRFAVGEFPVPLASLDGGTATTLRIPRDNARQPWFAQVSASQRVRACG
jgi:hypothetical protein